MNEKFEQKGFLDPEYLWGIPSGPKENEMYEDAKLIETGK